MFEDMGDKERMLGVIVMEDNRIDCSLFVKRKAIGTDSYMLECKRIFKCMNYLAISMWYETWIPIKLYLY